MNSQAVERHPLIDDGVSAYLDFTRTAAAIVVVFSHLLPILLGINAIPGNDAVIVFFVISGYVIAYAHRHRDVAAGRFFFNRLARLWSVLLPSLLLSALAAVIVGHKAEILFAPSLPDLPSFLIAAAQNAVFLGQNWGWHQPAPYNEPTWSLNYEAWYYVIFGAFAFAPRPWRWYVTIACAVLAGPAIIVLMPCWLVGAWLYRRRDDIRMSARGAVWLFAACTASYAATYSFDLNTQSRAWLSAATFGLSYHLRGSTGLIADIVGACLFGGTIVAVQNMDAANRVLASLRWLAKKVSSRTFSLYLYHMPIFTIVHGGFGFGRGSGVQAGLCVATVIAACVALGGVTEARLPGWRNGLSAAFRRVSRYVLPHGANVSID